MFGIPLDTLTSWGSVLCVIFIFVFKTQHTLYLYQECTILCNSSCHHELWSTHPPTTQLSHTYPLKLLGEGTWWQLYTWWCALVSLGCLVSVFSLEFSGMQLRFVCLLCHVWRCKDSLWLACGSLLDLNLRAIYCLRTGVIQYIGWMVMMLPIQFLICISWVLLL